MYRLDNTQLAILAIVIATLALFINIWSFRRAVHKNPPPRAPLPPNPPIGDPGLHQPLEHER